MESGRNDTKKENIMIHTRQLENVFV